MTRTVIPHPAAHSGHTLGFHTACPKRMSAFSGLLQLASAALVLEIAVSLMKDRRSITSMPNAQCPMPNGL